jgi:AcrR family transcriptional regulator
MPANQGERARRRLSTAERREQLLSVGARLFSESPYDDVWIEQVAEIAGVSRGLLYHYFPTKRDFYVAVTRAAADEVRELTEPDATLEPVERVRAGLDAFLQHAQTRSQGFLTAYRGRLAGDAEVRAIVEEGRQRQATKILAAVTGHRRPPPLLRLAVEGWIAFVQDVTARWLEAKGPSREAVCDVLMGALDGALDAAAET